MSNQFKPGDWSELKRLAEAAIEARPDRQYPTFGYAKAMSQLHEKASPEAILALIAENERLQGLACAVNSAMHEAGMPVDADPADLADVIHRLQVQVAALQSSPNSWQSGYDKGRADGTKTRLSELEQERRINAQLRAEVEALRKDAKRYRFVRELAWYVDQAAYVYEIGNSRSPWTSERGPVDADDIEMAIDAAMGKGGRSDG